jgi:hypothetical protein
MKHTQYILDFSGADLDVLDDDIRSGASAAIITENYLWVGSDEHISVQRLKKLRGNKYGECKTYHLIDFIDLPSQKDEMDIEGMDYDGKYLWVVGSHSWVRENIDGEAEDQEEEAKKLCEVSIDKNRCILARIPCVKNKEGEYELHKECPDPADDSKTLWAATLKHKKTKSQLTKKLKKDIHLGNFIKIPGKDNGLDIEGLAAYQDKIFLGLRGPVLRGWATILELKLKEHSKKKQCLKLKKLDNGRHYRKFFLDLKGMGVRELAADGDDMLILAGPTMDLDGTMSIYNWKGGSTPQPDRLIAKNEITRLMDIPTDPDKYNVDKAEGLAILKDKSLLVLYDTPDNAKTIGKNSVKADCFTLSGQ